MMDPERLIDKRAEYIGKLADPKEGDRILNVGVSNIPQVEMILENKCRECWTIDIDRAKLEKAGRFLSKTRMIEGDVTKEIGFREGYFDKVIALEVLEHLDDESALKNLSRIMKRGGEIVVSVPNNSLWHLINPVKYTQHKRHYSNQDIAGLLERNGFRIVHFNLVENWTLIISLYVHLFNKFILRKNKEFGIMRKSAERTYLGQNKKGVDIILKAVKD